MIKYMIGMYGKFDINKYNRDFRNNFYGVEACQFNDINEFNKLIKYSTDYNFRYGIHFPLLKDNNRIRDALILSNDENVKIDAYKYIEEQLKIIRLYNLKVEYILFHYPKPVILCNDFDFTDWRFSDKTEYVFQDKYSINELQENSETFFEYLNDISIKYEFIPILELDALNKYIIEDNILINLLEKYNRIKLCLDTGRIHLQNMIDKDFDDIKLIKKYARFTNEVHLWNVKVNENKVNSHYPVLSSLKEEDGWAPIEKYLKILYKENKDLIIMFEHRSDIISLDELNDCYNWIDSILN